MTVESSPFAAHKVSGANIEHDIEDQAEDIAAGRVASQTLAQDASIDAHQADDAGFDDAGITEAELLAAVANVEATEVPAQAVAPPESGAQATSRALTEFAGADPLDRGERLWKNDPDGILQAWKDCCYAATEERFNLLWQRLGLEFEDQAGKWLHTY